MGIRVFIFCDCCNPQGIRIVTDNHGFDRRNSDGRSWFEGSSREAIKMGWKTFGDNKIICPNCVESDIAKLMLSNQIDFREPRIEGEIICSQHET